MRCPTCGTYHQPGAHGPATPPAKSPEQPPEQPAPPPEDSQPDGGDLSGGGAADGGDSGTDDGADEDRDDGEGGDATGGVSPQTAAAPGRASIRKQPAPPGQATVRANGQQVGGQVRMRSQSEVAEGMATLAAAGAQPAPAGVSSGSALPPPPPDGSPAHVWEHYRQALPETHANRQAARYQANQTLRQIPEESRRREMAESLASNEYERTFARWTGVLPTMDEETDRQLLTKAWMSAVAAVVSTLRDESSGRMEQARSTMPAENLGQISIADDPRLVALLEAQPVDSAKTIEFRARVGDFVSQIEGQEAGLSSALEWRTEQRTRPGITLQRKIRGSFIRSSTRPQREDAAELDAANEALSQRWETWKTAEKERLGESGHQKWGTEQRDTVLNRVAEEDREEFYTLIDNVLSAKEPPSWTPQTKL